MSEISGADPVMETARRPKNRRELILRAAARLFRERGFFAVGIEEICEAVGVTGTTLYRHFDSKEDLLAAALRRAVDGFAIEEFLTRAGVAENGGSAADLRDRFVGSWVEAAIVNWDYFAILPRETDALSPRRLEEHYAALEPVDSLIRRYIAEANPSVDPTQLQMRWLAIIGGINGVLRYGEWVHRRRYQASWVGVERAMFVASPAAPFAERRPKLRPATEYQRASTRERVLSYAVEQFAHVGFAPVSIEEIGRGAGITGPGVYRHFADKKAILGEAIDRFDGALRTMLFGSLSQEQSPAEAVDDLTHALVALTYASPDLAVVYFTQRLMLSTEESESSGARKPLLFEEWEYQLRRSRPELTKWAARTVVYAVTGALVSVSADADMRHYDYRDALTALFQTIQRTV